MKARIQEREQGDVRLALILETLGRRPILRESDDDVWMAFGRTVQRDRTEGAGTTTRSPLGQLGAGSDQDLLGSGDEDDESFLGRRAPLDLHTEAVGELAADFGQRLGLGERLTESLRWAGRLHDVGKADPRFQMILHGGDPIEARFGPRLAKSMVPWQDAASRRRVRALAEYPTGQRHELVSLAMLRGNESLQESVSAGGADWELVLHLVAAHHGWCRPLAPVAILEEDDSETVEWTIDGHNLKGSTAHEGERLDSGVAQRFFALSRRYGWHGLAYLEAILRLADHRQSAREAGE